jgi:uncharacterized protein YndB with AHSA1/START domain
MTQSIAGSTPKVTLERTFDASLEDVWTLWTTADGIEAWWGPEGFEVKVRTLDLEPGGRLEYEMIAVAPDQVDFMKKAGMPISNLNRINFTEVDPPRRLAYLSLVDFVPGVAEYEVAVTVDLADSPGGVRMVLTLDAMHDSHWTDMAVRGWESELDKLAGVVALSRATAG